MKKRKPGKFLTMALTAIVSFTMIFGSTCFAQAASYSKTKTAFEKCGDYLYTTVKEPAYGSIGGEWVVYGLANAGYDFADTWLKTYVKTVEDALKTGYRGTEGILHDRKFQISIVQNFKSAFRCTEDVARTGKQCFFLVA